MPGKRHGTDTGASIDQLIDPPIAAEVVETAAIPHLPTLPQRHKDHPDLRGTVTRVR
jgi:hypothetical protein